MSQVDPPAHTDTKEVLDAPTPLHGEISLDESIHRKVRGGACVVWRDAMGWVVFRMVWDGLG